MTKKCRECYARVGADGWRCDPCAARWKKYTDDYIAARAASGGKGWEHANCDHAYGYCAATPTNTFESCKGCRDAAAKAASTGLDYICIAHERSPA